MSKIFFSFFWEKLAIFKNVSFNGMKKIHVFQMLKATRRTRNKVSTTPKNPIPM